VSAIPLIVALSIIFVLIVVLWIALGKEAGPSAIDAAVSYALARARGDWSTVYDLSAKELRANRDRSQFVAAHRHHDDTALHVAHPHARVEQATVTTEVGVVVVHVDDPDLTLRLDVQRRDSRWVIVAADAA
jgi:hypothetical protein